MSRRGEATQSVRSGALRVGVGLAVLGLSSYGYLTVAARTLTPGDFALLSVLWTLVYIVGPGLFVPLEQELGRVVSARHAAGRTVGPVLRRAAALAGSLLAAVTGLLLLTAPLTIERLFGGQVSLLVVFVGSLAAVAAAYLSRGLLGGLGRFAAYSRQLAVEGLVRLALVGVLALLAVQATAWYGVLLPVAIVVAVAVTVPRGPFGDDGAAAPWGELVKDLGLLLVASLCSQALIHVAPVAVRLLVATTGGAEAGKLLAASVVARAPLFLFAALQAALLPDLSRSVAAGDLRRYTAELRKALVLVGVVAGLGLAVAALAGSELVSVVFGSALALGRVDMVLLAISTSIYLVAMVFQPALIAMGRHGATAGGWGAGMTAFVAFCLLPVDPVRRVELALVVGALTAALVLGLAVRRALHGGRAHRRPVAPTMGEELL